MTYSMIQKSQIEKTLNELLKKLESTINQYSIFKFDSIRSVIEYVWRNLDNNTQRYNFLSHLRQFSEGKSEKDLYAFAAEFVYLYSLLRKGFVAYFLQVKNQPDIEIKLGNIKAKMDVKAIMPSEFNNAIKEANKIARRNKLLVGKFHFLEPDIKNLSELLERKINKKKNQSINTNFYAFYVYDLRYDVEDIISALKLSGVSNFFYLNHWDLDNLRIVVK